MPYRSLFCHHQQSVLAAVSGTSFRGDSESSSSGRDCAKPCLGFRSSLLSPRGLGLRVSSLRYYCVLEGHIFHDFSVESKLRAKRLSMGGGVVAFPVAGIPIKSKLTDGDGIVIVDHGSRRAQSNAMLHEFVKLYKEKTCRSNVEAAHMELADPTISDAFDRCVEQGASRIIISPYFLFPGRHWDKNLVAKSNLHVLQALYVQADIPSIAAEAAKKHPNVPYLVTAPIGLHELMVTVMNDRMEYCLSQVAGEVSECDMCFGSGRCKQSISQESQAGSDSLATLGKQHSGS